MNISQLRSSVYGHRGPFATVYLEGRPPDEESDQQVRLRWKALRERLADAEADPVVLDELEGTLFSEQSGKVQVDGRVLIATASGILLDAPWGASLGSGDDAYWTDEPELGPFVREEARSVRLLVAIANQNSAVIRQEVAAERHSLNDVGTEYIEGNDQSGVHKPRGGALAHNRIQRRADETSQQNARDIASRLASIAKAFNPHVLVLAGGAQGRTALRGELSEKLLGLCVEAERGGVDDDSAESALAEQLRDIAATQVSRHAEEISSRFAEAAAHQRAVTGVEATGRAASMGAVDTLLFQIRRPATQEATLLAACARGGADVDLVTEDTELLDGVGALLRFPLDSTNPMSE